jgi:pimeloyl-ACP methyl ester carboxylesterase
MQPRRSFPAARPWAFLKPLATTSALVTALALSACGGGDDGPAPGDLVSNSAFTAPANVAAVSGSSRKLIHWMPGAAGKPVKATALLFLPQGTAPAGGWPVVAWVHGTQSIGTGAPAATACSASDSATLDGGLTAAGFTSYYSDTIAALLGAGYAVVAPDLEGYGAQAQADGTAAAYYNLASSGNAVAGALLAARQASTQLSKNWASVGHSEGGHAALGLETTASAAGGLSYKGTVAVAPYANIAAGVQTMGALIAADPANELNYRGSQENTVLMFGTVLATQNSGWQPANVMNADLLALVPMARSSCILQQFGSVIQAVATKGTGAFTGFKASWADEPAMKAFLAANDIGVNTSFRLAKPTFVLQGTADPFVFESLQTPFMGRLKTAGMPVTYKTYPGADHGDVLVQGRADMLAFLKTLLP